MRLSKIKLSGFKSFVDPTSISFPGNLLGVVGPNGCGKSNIIDAVRWVLEALWLGMNPRGGLDPEAFQTRLPKSFIHRVVPGDPVQEFVHDWREATRDTQSVATWGPRAWFVAAGQALRAKGYDLARPAHWLKRGWLVWRGCDLQV